MSDYRENKPLYSFPSKLPHRLTAADTVRLQVEMCKRVGIIGEGFMACDHIRQRFNGLAWRCIDCGKILEDRTK